MALPRAAPSSLGTPHFAIAATAAEEPVRHHRSATGPAQAASRSYIQQYIVRFSMLLNFEYRKTSFMQWFGACFFTPYHMSDPFMLLFMLCCSISFLSISVGIHAGRSRPPWMDICVVTSMLLTPDIAVVGVLGCESWCIDAGVFGGVPRGEMVAW